MMAIVGKWAFFFVACLILQSSLVYTVSVAGIQPDLIMLALFLLSVKYGSLPGVYVGFILGVGQDLYSPSVLGQNALANSITGFLIGLFNERMMRTDPPLKMVILLLAFCVHDSVFALAQVFREGSSLSLLMSGFFFTTIPRALYSGLIIALFYLWDLFLKPSMRR